MLPPSPEISIQILSPFCGLDRRVHACWMPSIFPRRSSRVRPSTTADWTLDVSVALVGSTIPSHDTGTGISLSPCLFGLDRTSFSEADARYHLPCHRTRSQYFAI